MTVDIVAALPWPFAIMGIYHLLVRHTPILAAVGAVIAMVGWTMAPSPATLGALFSLFIEGCETGTLLLASRSRDRASRELCPICIASCALHNAMV